MTTKYQKRTLLVFVVFLQIILFSAIVTADNTVKLTKLDLRGKVLLTQTHLKSSWACVKDNSTNLVWEVKTNIGLQHKSSKYTWYSSNKNYSSRESGTKVSGNCGDSMRCNTQKYVNDVNSKTLCGANNWRLPTLKELKSIVKINKNKLYPTINLEFFPNTKWGYYWSSTNKLGIASAVGFDYGNKYDSIKNVSGYVRLVHSSE